MKAFIATPAYSGSVSVEYAGALIAGLSDLNRRGIQTDISILPGLCYIDLARDQLARLFLLSDATDLIFVDDDVGFQPDGLWQLLRHDRDIVGGVYPKKTEQPEWPFKPLANENGGYVFDAETGLIECEGLPTGFLRIRRNVLERMTNAFPERVYVNDQGDQLHEFFPVERVGYRKFGEDYRFCQMARECGFRLWAEPDLTFTHTGRKVWAGNYDKFARAHG